MSDLFDMVAFNTGGKKRNMRHKIAALALILAFLVGGDDIVNYEYEEEAYADTAFSFSLFYNSLSPYGSWVPISGYGYGWYPSQAGPGWQPYMDGQWVWSDQGWTWASAEPWGWATYHYGRWIYDPYYGWTWIPGSVWAPAWVSWYQSPGYIGWSPLPPDNNFFIEIGIGFSNYGYGYGPYYGGYYGGGYYDGGGYYGHHHHHHDKGHYYDNDYYAPGEHCVFVPEDKFSNRNAKLYRVDGERNLTVMRNVKNVTNIKTVNNTIYNYGPDKTAVERASGQKLKPVNLVDSDLSTLRAGKGGRNLDNNNYKVFRPNIERKADETPFTGENNVLRRAENGRNTKGAGVNNAFTSGEKNTGNNPGQDRSLDRPGNKSYGNTAPDDYGVIKKNTGRNAGPAAPDYGNKGDYPDGKNTPDYNQGGPDRNATVTNRQKNPYPGQPVYNNQNRVKSNKAVNDRMRSYQAPVPAPQQQQSVDRNPYNKYRGPGGSLNPYQSSGKSSRQTYNKPALQQRNTYNPNGYKAQSQQAPKYNYQPSQRQSNASSSKKSSTRSYSPPQAQYTSPSVNQGARSYNPGSSRSYNSSSFAGRK